MTLTVGSLFSGIGGLDLGLERAGMQVIWQSEIDPFCCKVLKQHWPKVVNHGDIRNIEWGNVERPDVICGGYPCQPFSQAGKRRGENDPRHLWPIMFDAIRNLRPRYALLENVRGHLSMGFGTVLANLASIGFDAEWQIIPAAAVGAPHKRDRLFVVAYPNDARSGTPERNNKQKRAQSEQERQNKSQHRIGRRGANVADTDIKGLQGRKQAKPTTTNAAMFAGGSRKMANTNGAGGGGFGSLSNGRKTVFGAENKLRGENGVAGGAWWETEPNVGRVADGVPNRVDKLRGLGNAVVPQIAEFVGRLIINNLE